MMVLAPSSGEIAPIGLATRDQRRQHPAGLVAEAGGDKTGMQAIGGDAGAGEAPRQFAGEQDVAELGFGIDAKAAITLLALQIVEIELGAAMRVGRGGDDARAGLQPGAAADW